MKLLELLVRELPKRGGWPEDISIMKKFSGIYGYVQESCGIGMLIDNFDIPVEKVTREQYEAALAASKKVKWNGSFPPPVGIECEAKYREAANAEWFFFRCVGVDCGVAFGWAGKDAVTLGEGRYEFRPIRSEEDRKRDEVGLALYHAINWSAEGELVSPSRMEDYKKAYDAIAAGEISGVKLSD